MSGKELSVEGLWKQRRGRRREDSEEKMRLGKVEKSVKK